MMPFSQDSINLLLFALLCLIAVLLVSLKPGLHHYKLKTAKRVYTKIQELEDASVIPYLRKIDPFVFEELVLWAFKQKGYKVYRNRRYSGDGGIDGKMKVNGRKILIQDKRYQGYIQMAHVRDFDQLCRRRHRYGIFVHTGKTRKESNEIAYESDRIVIISGKRLVKLLRANV